MKVKYLFRSMLAMAGVFAATSCSQEELYTETEGDFVEASFTIETPDAILSRAIGDGTTVDQVACAVFDANGDEMKQLRDTIEIVGQKAQYNVRLAKGQKYRVAFFAYNEEANAYDGTDMKKIQVLGNQASNVEGRDAFTAKSDITPTTAAIKETVTLRRPFAQLNLGAYPEDIEAAKNAGIEVKKSKVTVTNVYTAFNAYEDKVVEGEGATTTVTFALNAIPTEALKVDVDRNNTITDDEKFAYLALNYILVGNEGSEKSLVDVTFEWESKDSKTNAPGSTFNNIPVQRNYRTNIVGSLLTNPAEFNIEIDARFDGDISESRVFNLIDLQTAIDNAPVGKTTVISLGADIKGDVIEHQKADRNIVIDGCGYKYDGTIKIHSGSTRNNGTITIKNVKFETSTSALNFIMPNDFGVENGVTRRYSNNIFVEDCTFTATGAAENTAVGVQAKSAQNVQVKNCTATGMHSLLQAQSCDTDVIVENATIKGKNGVAFKQVKNAEVKGTTIEATGYGIRFDGNTDNYGITVKDNNVTAAQPFIVRKMTAQNNKITLEGTNTLTVGTMSRAEGPAYQIVITNGSDDEAYVVPTGTYTLTGADDFVVYPPIENYDAFLAKISDDTWYDDTKTELAVEDVADFAAFVETANSGNDFEGKTIKLTGDIDLYFKDVTALADGDPITFRPIGDTKYNGGKPFMGTFDGQGHTIKNLYQNGWDLGYEWGVYGSYGLFGKLEDATVKNVVIKGSESYIEGGDVSFIAGSATGNCVFENITIENSTIATYNNGCGGIIGWSGAGTYTFKDITIGEGVVLGGLWGSFDSSIGGIVGQAEPGATYNFENVTINCRIDAYNDCTASYDYHNYRMCGMIIGRCEETTTIDGKNYPDLSKYNLTFNNVTVNYGDWMNYHYCRVSGQRAVRVEPGYSYGGIAADRDHSKDNAYCMNWIPFNQLIGGDQLNVKGLPAVDGVTVNYPASYDEEKEKGDGGHDSCLNK